MTTPTTVVTTSIAELLHGEYTLKTNIHYKLRPVIEALEARGHANCYIADRYLDGAGENVVLHLREGGRLAQIIVTIPVSMIDTPDAVLLRAFLAPFSEN